MACSSMSFLRSSRPRRLKVSTISGGRGISRRWRSIRSQYCVEARSPIPIGMCSISFISRPVHTGSAAGSSCRVRGRCGAASSSGMVMAGGIGLNSICRSRRRRCSFPAAAGCRSVPVHRFLRTPPFMCSTISTSLIATSSAAASMISGLPSRRSRVSIRGSRGISAIAASALAAASGRWRSLTTSASIAAIWRCRPLGISRCD